MSSAMTVLLVFAETNRLQVRGHTIHRRRPKYSAGDVLSYVFLEEEECNQQLLGSYCHSLLQCSWQLKVWVSSIRFARGRSTLNLGLEWIPKDQNVLKDCLWRFENIQELNPVERFQNIARAILRLNHSYWIGRHGFSFSTQQKYLGTACCQSWIRNASFLIRAVLGLSIRRSW